MSNVVPSILPLFVEDGDIIRTWNLFTVREEVTRRNGTGSQSVFLANSQIQWRESILDPKELKVRKMEDKEEEEDSVAERGEDSRIRKMEDKKEEEDPVAKRGRDLIRKTGDKGEEICATRGVIRDFIRGIFGSKEPKVVAHGFIPWLMLELRDLVIWIKP